MSFAYEVAAIYVAALGVFWLATTVLVVYVTGKASYIFLMVYRRYKRLRIYGYDTRKALRMSVDYLF